MSHRLIGVTTLATLATLWAVAEVRGGALSPRQLAAMPARGIRWAVAGLRRRHLAAEQRLLEWPAILRAAMSDRGACRACGDVRQLKRDGRIPRHHDCPGGDDLPAPTLIGADHA